MSRIFEALQKSTPAAELTGQPDLVPSASELVQEATADPFGLQQCQSFTPVTTPEGRLVAAADEGALGAEKIRVLATKLRHMRGRRPLKKLLVTSSMQGEGKSVIAANLAVTLAKHARARTLLIDGDLRRPSLARLLGCESGPTLADWWRDDLPPQRVLRRAADIPLWFLPAGEIAMQPLEILQSQRMAEFLNNLSEILDWVVIDSPPMTPIADSGVWSSLCDGILVVVREGLTLSKLFSQTVESIDAKKFLGVVINGASMSESQYNASYYYHSQQKK